MKNVPRLAPKGFLALLAAAIGLVVAGVAWNGGGIGPARRPSVQLTSAPPTVPYLEQATHPAAAPPRLQALPDEPAGRAGSSLTKKNDAVKSQREVAFSQARTGWKLVEAGEYRRAAQVFTVATQLVPHEASFLVGLGVSQHHLSRDDLAVTALERAIQLDANAGQAHKLLGDIYYARHEIKTALGHYEKARRLDPNDVVMQDRLLAARREYRSEAGLDRLFSPHFVVKFQGPTDRDVASAVANRLEKAYNTVGRGLAYFPSELFTVILYPDEQFRDVTLSPHWARGLFDGQIHLPIGTIARDPREEDTILTHEYTHAVVHRLSGGHAPTWLNEGLALYFEGGAKPWGSDYFARHAEELMPLRLLHGSFLELPPGAATVAYAESYGATKVLIRRYGLVQVRQLLAALADAPDFSNTFQTVMRGRYGDFDATWVPARAEQRF